MKPFFLTNDQLADIVVVVSMSRRMFRWTKLNSTKTKGLSRRTPPKERRHKMKSKTLIAGVITGLVCTLAATGIAVPASANHPVVMVNTSPAALKTSPVDPYAGAVGTLTVTKITKTHITMTDEAGAAFTRPLTLGEKYTICLKKLVKKNPKFAYRGDLIMKKCSAGIPKDTGPDLDTRPVKANEVHVNAQGQTVFPLNRRINFRLMTLQEINWLVGDENEDLSFKDSVATATVRRADIDELGSNYAEVLAIAEINRARENAFLDMYRDAAWTHKIITRVPNTTSLRDYTLYEYPLVIGVKPWTSDPRLTPVKPWTVEQSFKYETRKYETRKSAK